ncbi:uncharacterized protein LOC142760421 [Rhinoderma darwinii]|uniref:uncharacterized protein LOC142760421 n=1 Tax=Rhinoderma darwinii TaxID=43563 RepID=UPI003F67672B
MADLGASLGPYAAMTTIGIPQSHCGRVMGYQRGQHPLSNSLDVMEAITHLDAIVIYPVMGKTAGIGVLTNFGRCSEVSSITYCRHPLSMERAQTANSPDTTGLIPCTPDFSDNESLCSEITMTNHNTLKFKNMEHLSKMETYLQSFKDIVIHLMENIESCIKEMTRIADDLDDYHRGATIASVAGSSFGIAGGIVTIVGLALAPVTLGASLIVSGVGIGVAVAGGITGAGASIADTVNIKKNSKLVQEMVGQIDVMMKRLKKISYIINLEARNLQCRFGGDKSFDLTRVLGRSTLTTLEISRIAQLGKITTVASRGAQLATRGVQAAAAISGVLAGLFIIIDAVFIVNGAIDLHKGSKTEEAAKIRTCAADLQKLYQDLQEVYSLLSQDLSFF